MTPRKDSKKSTTRTTRTKKETKPKAPARRRATPPVPREGLTPEVRKLREDEAKG